jgi:DNA-binding transcriptional LysR family regulator
MRSELARYSDGLRSPLLIQANTSATETLMPTVIAEFLAENPDVDLELEERPSHDIVTECMSHPFVGFTEGNPLQEHLSGQAQPLGLRPRYRAHLPTTEAICGAVAAGIGIAVVPAVAAARWERTYRLHSVELTNAWAQRHMLLCCRDRNELSVHAAALAAHLAATA